jgi:3-deoxy-manno-octulosonate cytidylyltransferase (CMP-KDO synthetase)
VARRALGLNLGGQLVVATDDRRVVDAVAPLGVKGVLTRKDHISGTARVAEVLTRPEFADTEVVVNLQGDEPFLPVEAAVGAIGRLELGDEIGTAAAPASDQVLRDPNRVKVEVDDRGRARRFYRAPISTTLSETSVYQHLGIYAYSPETLQRWLALPPVFEEIAEELEQLRPLAHGLSIGVATIAAEAPHGIDTEEDLRIAEALL